MALTILDLQDLQGQEHEDGRSPDYFSKYDRLRQTDFKKATFCRNNSREFDVPGATGATKSQNKVIFEKSHLRNLTFKHKNDLNGVAMAPHGLILSQDGATAFRNLFKYLLGPPEAIFGPKINKHL